MGDDAEEALTSEATNSPTPARSTTPSPEPAPAPETAAIPDTDHSKSKSSSDHDYETCDAPPCKLAKKTGTVGELYNKNPCALLVWEWSSWGQ